MKPGSVYTHSDGKSYHVVEEGYAPCVGCAWRMKSGGGCLDFLDSDGCIGVILKEINDGTHTGSP